MIIDKLVQFLTAFLNGILNLLPTWSIPNFDGLGLSFGTGLAGLNALFPITTLGICLGIVVGLQLFLFAWSAIVYVYRLIPLKFT